MVFALGLNLATASAGFCRVDSMGGFSFLRSASTGVVRAELLCIPGGQLLKAADLHGFGTDDAAEGLTGKEPVEDVEADVPARGAPRDVAAIDVLPERESRAGALRLELPSKIEITPSVLEQFRSVGSLHGAIGNVRLRR